MFKYTKNQKQRLLYPTVDEQLARGRMVSTKAVGGDEAGGSYEYEKINRWDRKTHGRVRVSEHHKNKRAE